MQNDCHSKLWMPETHPKWIKPEYMVQWSSILASDWNHVDSFDNLGCLDLTERLQCDWHRWGLSESFWKPSRGCQQLIKAVFENPWSSWHGCFYSPVWFKCACWEPLLEMNGSKTWVCLRIPWGNVLKYRFLTSPPTATWGTLIQEAWGWGSGILKLFKWFFSFSFYKKKIISAWLI